MSGEKLEKRHDQTGELDNGTPMWQGGVDVWEGACPWREGRVEEAGRGGGKGGVLGRGGDRESRQHGLHSEKERTAKEKN